MRENQINTMSKATVIVKRQGKIQKAMDVKNKDNRLRDNVADG